MSITYPEFPGTLFPDSADVLYRMSDLEIGEVALANEYNRLYYSGDINGANQILLNNPNLKNKILNADNINRIFDMILSMQKFFIDNGFAGSGFKSRGLWNDLTNFETGDNVSHNNIIWQAREDNLNSEPTDANSDWLKVLEPIAANGFTWGQAAGKD